MCSGRAPWRAACRAAAAPPERRRPAVWRPGGCSCRRPARSTRAGAAGAAAGPPTPCRATAPQTDHPGLVPTRAKRCAATLPEPRPARARAPMPMPGHPPPAEVAEQGLRPMTARQSRHRLPHRRREQQRERRRMPETATRLRSTPTAAVARRHARCRGACAPERLATGTAGVFPVATLPVHSPAGGSPTGTDRCPRSLTSPEHPPAGGAPPGADRCSRSLTSPEPSPAGGANPGADRCPRSPCSSASPDAAGRPSCLVPPAESWS